MADYYAPISMMLYRCTLCGKEQRHAQSGFLNPACVECGHPTCEEVCEDEGSE